MRIKKYIFALLSLMSSVAMAQDQKPYYASPVTFPIYLAGNVGEVRSTHFHSGIDIKATQGIGSEIKAVADGYISRIGVSPSGYGNVLYITHSNGETSVYAHLNGFVDKIQKWVKGRQYQKQGFKVDLYPLKTEFPVKQGETVAYLGNSGSSGGPHLHFEIRDGYQNPRNIVQQKVYKIQDDIAPTFGAVTLYECDTVAGIAQFTRQQTIKAINRGGGKYELEKPLFTTNKPYYFVYEVIDYKNGAPNTMGIYSLTQKVDDFINYSFKIDKISFATSKYSNTAAQHNHKSRFHPIRSYVSANNGLTIYRNVRNRGLILPTLDSLKSQTIATEIEDDNGNKSYLSFEVKSYPKTPSKPKQLEANQRVVAWNRTYTYQDSILQVTIPSRALYDSDIIEFQSDSLKQEFTVGNDQITLHKSYEVKLKVGEIEPKLQSKALYINRKGSGLAILKYNNGTYSGKLSKFGTYGVTYDTIAPKITPLKTQNNQLRFKVTDNLSGINTYNLKINGKWQLLEYEPKQNLMFHRLDPSQQPKKNKVEINVTDYSGNKTVLNCEL